jgi:hypothetical protein
MTVSTIQSSMGASPELDLRCRRIEHVSPSQSEPRRAA